LQVTQDYFEQFLEPHFDFIRPLVDQAIEMLDEEVLTQGGL
jgi:hypothetical protein